MINFKYDRDSNMIRVDTGDLKLIGDYLKLEIYDWFGNKVWETDLRSNSWAEWKGGEILFDAIILDNDNNLIEKFKWNIPTNGNMFEKYLYYYCKKNKDSKGLCIGTHDGLSGHWVRPILDKITSAVLIEPSNMQHSNLVNNYRNTDNVEILKEIVTSDGRDVTWYEGGLGYTNTINKEVINIFLTDDEITEQVLSTVKIQDMINKYQPDLDWLHLDTEGADGELILSLDVNPDIIIYESAHLKDKTPVEEWFTSNGYQFYYEGIDGMAIKKYKLVDYGTGDI